MLLSIKTTIAPLFALSILVLLGVLIYGLFSKKFSRNSIAYIAVAIIVLFGLMVMSNYKDEKGEHYWKAVNE